MPSAIVIVGQKNRRTERGDNGASVRDNHHEGCLSCVEVLGRSVVRRMLEQLLRNGMDSISLFVDNSLNSEAFAQLTSVRLHSQQDAWGAAAQELMLQKERGSDAVLVAGVGAYAEFDLADLLQFHVEHGKPVTRMFDERGLLDLWVVDPARISESEDLRSSLRRAKPVYYRLQGYVNRLENPHDMRMLVIDGLTSRCQLRPLAFEVRPGVWLAEGAQVERGARIVAPAFIGRDVTIADQCLITRCSNIESYSTIDFGTTVEDSSVLPNTYVGIGLDLSHSVVEGNILANVERDVMLEINDPVIVRQNNPREMEAHLRPSFRTAEPALKAG